jgi:hypothetical protein
MVIVIKKLSFSVALSSLLMGFVASGAAADSLSNRHHLSGCTQQSAPVVLPHADARTVRLGLPANVGASVDIQEVYGWDEETRLRLRRQGLTIQTEGGGATLILRQNHPCR